MTLEELEQRTKTAREIAESRGMPLHMSLIVSGWRNGDSVRVAKGLTGHFLSHVGGEENKGTLVLLDIPKVEKFIKKAKAEINGGTP